MRFCVADARQRSGGGQVITTYESKRTALLEIFERHLTTIENTPMDDDLRAREWGRG